MQHLNLTQSEIDMVLKMREEGADKRARLCVTMEVLHAYSECVVSKPEINIRDFIETYCNETLVNEDFIKFVERLYKDISVLTLPTSLDKLTAKIVFGDDYKNGKAPKNNNDELFAKFKQVLDNPSPTRSVNPHKTPVTREEILKKLYNK